MIRKFRQQNGGRVRKQKLNFSCHVVSYYFSFSIQTPNIIQTKTQFVTGCLIGISDKVNGGKYHGGNHENYLIHEFDIILPTQTQTRTYSHIYTSMISTKIQFGSNGLFRVRLVHGPTVCKSIFESNLAVENQLDLVRQYREGAAEFVFRITRLSSLSYSENLLGFFFLFHSFSRL